MSTIVHELVSFLTSETGLRLLGWILGCIFTAIKGTEFVKSNLDASRIKRLEAAYSLLEAAIVDNGARVAQMKAANNGKLTEEQQKQLEDSVIENLKVKAQETGIDALKIIGPAVIRPAIVHTVRRVKGSVIGQDATVLPSGVAKMFPSTDK